MEQATIASQKNDKRFILIFLAIPCLIINLTLNNDVWFLLNHGRYVLENGIPLIEPFTIHTGMSFVMQQWLTSAIFWLIYNTFGSIGLFVLLGVVFAGIITITYKLCMRLTDGNFIISYGTTLFISIFVSVFIVQRPYIFTTVLALIELYLLESYIATQKKRFLFFLPLLSVLQINLHASMWPILFVLLLPYLIDAFKFKFFFIQGQGYPKKWIFICTAVMFLVGFINPYGLDAMTYLFRSYGYPEISSMVGEMLPPNINDALGKLVFSAIFIVIFIYILYRKGSSRLRFALLTMGMGYLAISSVRNLLFFAICGIFPISYYLRDIKIKATTAAPARRIIIFRAVITLFICVGVIFTIVDKLNSTDSSTLLPEEARAVDYLLQHADAGSTRLYTDYNTGGYAEFKGFKVYIDPRAEVFVKANNHKEDILEEYYNLVTSKVYYKDFLEKYNFTHLLVSKDDVLDLQLLHDSSYSAVYEDENYSVYVKLT